MTLNFQQWEKTFIAVLLLVPDISIANRYADQLYEDLLYYYNKNVSERSKIIFAVCVEHLSRTSLDLEKNV